MEQNAKKKISCGGFMLGEGLVLSEDGKTLSVSGGGGGSGQFIVTVYNAAASESPVYKADKTYDEIKSAIDSGAMVLVHYKPRPASIGYSVYYNTLVDVGCYVFSSVDIGFDNISLYTIDIYDENGETVIGRNRYKLQLANQP